MLRDEYECVFDEYEQKVLSHKQEFRDNDSLSELCIDIKDAYYDITVGQTDRTLYSGKEIITKLDDGTYWTQHLTLNQDFIGTQYGSGTSKKSSPVNDEDFVKYMMKYGDDIADYLSGYNNKQDNTKWFASILNEHIDDISDVRVKKSIDATGYDASENTEVQMDNIMCKITMYNGVTLNINDNYAWSIDGSPHSLMICETIYDEIEEALLEAIDEIHEKRQQLKTSLQIINQEFTTELVAERI